MTTRPETDNSSAMAAESSAAPARGAAARPRRVLMVLLHFPPIGGVAMPRNLRNVEYLPRFGWEPVVITAHDTGGPLDPETLALVPPGIRVLRALGPEPRHLRRLADPVLALGGRVRLPRRSPHSGVAPASGGRDEVAKRSARGRDIRPAPPLLWRVYRALSFPDGQVGWLPFALAAAGRAHRDGGFDVVYSTSAPITAHFVAGIVARAWRVPWVAEFRDPWLGSPISDVDAGGRSWLYRRLRVKVERWIARSADRLVFVSPSTARLYRRRYPDAAGVVTIPNGHDRSEAVPRTVGRVPDRPFQIVWAGTLHRPGELRVLLEGLDALLRRRVDVVGALEVVFYGEVSDDCRAVAAEFEPRLGGAVRFAGFVPRRVALEAVAGADAAILTLGAGPGMGQFVPGKLFDYLGQDQQILAIVPPGDVRAILEELAWGVVSDPEPGEVERAIERLLTLPPPARPADPDGRYARLTLARRLAETLDAAFEAREGPARNGDGGRQRVGTT